MFIAGLLIVFLFPACVKEVERPLPGGGQSNIVVECILTNELKKQEVRMSFPYPQQNETPAAVSGAEVYVAANGQKWDFVELDSPAGKYVSATPFAVSIDNEYELHISYEGQAYSASTSVTALGLEEQENWVENLNDSTFRISKHVSSFSPNGQAMYEFTLMWHPEADSTYVVKTYRYLLNSLDVSNIFAPETEEIVFSHKTWIYWRKYSLTDDYAGFLRAMLAETQWQGGFFDDEKDNLPTNISNGGLGYFTACSVLSDTVYVP